uniref:Metallo-beta-lactamase domain-containing protein 1 n=1 Tax=Setaria digitata TaxID=48799 RepID=A0A915PWA4_9BILA
MFCLSAVFSLVIVRTVIPQKTNWLHDFARRGKGTVSKLPFEEIFIDQPGGHESEAFTVRNPSAEIEGQNEIVRIGGDFNMATGGGSRILPVSSDPSITNAMLGTFLSTTARSPTTTRTSPLRTTITGRHSPQSGTTAKKVQFNFKQLASFLQQMIDRRRKAKKNHTAKENDGIKRIEWLRNDSELGETIRSSFQENTFSVADLEPTELLYSHLNTQKPGNTYAISRRPEKEKAKSSSARNQRLAGTVSSSKGDINDNPMIYIIREGLITQNNENDYEFVSSITLITDGNKKLLVDTGLATDINGRTWMLERLSELSAPPPSISYVITTHGHPDHSGNTNDFPDALHYAGRFMHAGSHSNFSRILKNVVERLTENVYLLKTPGHASDDISVLIKNTSFFGTVIVSGDVFLRKEDMKYPTMWRPLATNEAEQEESRKRLLCLGDYIIPGHGPLFRVTSNMKQKLNCPSDY